MRLVIAPSSAGPKPTIKTKMKMPRKTPSAVSAVRSLCRPRLCAISW
jgi:hypothetical protein